MRGGRNSGMLGILLLRVVLPFIPWDVWNWKSFLPFQQEVYGFERPCLMFVYVCFVWCSCRGWVCGLR